MKILKFLLYWIKSIVDQIFGIPVAFLVYIIRFRKKNVYNILICEHIGDMIFTLGYLEAYKKEKKNLKLNIITTKKWIDLLSLYPNTYDSVTFVSRPMLNIVLFLDHYHVGQILLKKLNDIVIIDPGYNFTCGYEFAKQFPSLNLKECIKYGVLGLKEDAMFNAPIKKNVQYVSEKVLLLCPYASVTSEIDKLLYNDIIKKYSLKGYRILTNVTKNQKKLEGTEEINCNLTELYSKGDTFAGIIGLRSGILDLLSFCQCPILAIYPQDSTLDTFFDLSKTNPLHKKIFHYKLSDDIEKDKLEIMSILDELV